MWRHARMVEVGRNLDWPSNVWMGVSIENRRFVQRTDYLREIPAAVRFVSAEPLLGPLEHLDLTGIDWLIAGGESGPGHRPVREEWLLGLRDRCLQEHVAFFFKQWGGRTPKIGGRELEGRTWNEMPRPATREPRLGRDSSCLVKSESRGAPSVRCPVSGLAFVLISSERGIELIAAFVDYPLQTCAQFLGRR